MTWVFWLVGILWVIDGFFYFVFPAFVKKMLVQVRRRSSLFVVGLGPLLAAGLLGGAAYWTGVHRTGLGALAFLSLLQGFFFNGRPLASLLQMLEKNC